MDGLVIGQRTEGYGTAQMCPQDPFGDFCQTDFGPFNPHGVLNWPEPNNPDVEKTELRYPPFLRNPTRAPPMPATSSRRPAPGVRSCGSTPTTGRCSSTPNNPSRATGPT